MKYPRDWVEIENGCFAVWRKASGPRTSAGPVLHGRPVVKYGGENWKCSRLSYSLNCEELPRTPKTLKEGIVCHTCDNSWCINPKHLYLGTAKQNTEDMYNRNKFVKERMKTSKMGNTNRRGKKASEETRANISRARMGNKNKLNKTESFESRLKKSAAQKKLMSENEEIYELRLKNLEKGRLSRWGR